MNKLLDTNILIDYFRGDKRTRKYLEMQPMLVSSPIILAELIQGARNKQELKTLQTFQGKIYLIPFSPTLGQKMLELMKTYSFSHGLQIPDALIAATALEEKLTLVTGNVKHFNFIKGLQIVDWQQEKKLKSSA
ncbi:hypothetical protein A2160_04790 [Candidatus Beckwithbacteria bacterium RBG_13_42_9]|uniref:Ribonuclease VapC n=1 Tax=Candidatus Beckwithbacteria bacterium RBG_13_42_9 TaxID=1797457 RepID=A0A1F5E670_9BACT|nr:MAG: hypothetical protein A2160_04790 [Candidatus Beckwithbacteria bacterium RBG_13_42_9]